MNNKKINIDYSALDQLPKGIVRYMPPVAFTTAMISIALITINSSSNNSLIYVLAPIAFVALVLGVLYSFKSYKMRKNVMSKFAAANGFTFTPNFHTVQGETGSVFSYGFDRETGNILSGKIGDFSFREGTFKYETGDDNSFRSTSFISFGTTSSNDTPQSQTHYLEFMCIELPRKLPQIIINSKKAQALSTFYSNSQKISLEGDFDKYFNVFAPANYERTTLTILTPDVMAFLIDKSIECDIEIIDSKLYLYWHADRFKDKNDYKKKFDLAIGILNQIGRQLSSANILDQDGTASNTVSSDGLSSTVRLKKSWWMYIIVPVIVLIYFIISFIIDLTN